MKQRYEWIDLLRGMVWVHAANMFLTTNEQGKPWLQGLIFCHGIIALVFFWGANYRSILKCWLDMRPDFAFARASECQRSTSSPHLCNSAYD